VVVELRVEIDGLAGLQDVCRLLFELYLEFALELGFRLAFNWLLFQDDRGMRWFIVCRLEISSLWGLILSLNFRLARIVVLLLIVLRELLVICRPFFQPFSISKCIQGVITA